MSIQSSITPMGAIGHAPTRTGDGFFASLFKSIVRAREAQARRVVSRYLAQMSDQQLADLGFTTDEVAAARRTAKIPVSYWA